MNRLNVQAFAEKMSEKGCEALASVLQDSFERAPAAARGAPETDDGGEGSEGKIDLKALKESAKREFERRVEFLEVTVERSDDKKTDSILTKAKLQKDTNLCQLCTQSLDNLLRTGKARIPIDCLDHFLSLLEELCLDDILEEMKEEISGKIVGRQMLDIYFGAKNPILSKLAYDFLLQRTFIYGSFVPEFGALLPFNLFRKLLEDDGLQVSSEDDVFELIRQHKPRDSDKLKKVLSCIRFPFLTCATYDTLLEKMPEISMCAEYQLCEKSNNWLSHSPEKQLTRRRTYGEHLHMLWHEEPLEEESEQLVITCQREGKSETLLSSLVTEELSSTVEARGRCAVSGEKIVVGADCGTKLWTWLIEANKDALGMPQEKCLDLKLENIEFLDATNVNKTDKLITWRDIEHRRCHMGLLQTDKDGEMILEKIPAPSSMESRRGSLHQDYVIIANSSQLVLFNRNTQTSTVYDSPAKSLSNFLDILVVSSAKKNCVYVYDFRVIAVTESNEARYKDLLLVFDLELLRWQGESWDIDLQSTNVNRRLYADAYNGITLFEYRGNPAVLAEIGEDFSVRYRIIFVHDGDDDDDQYTEAVADISAVTGEGRNIREVLGLLPIDLNQCSHQTVFNRYCRKHLASSDLTQLRKLAE